ncbi:hypothetical protein Plhal304r1_c027g0091731 [Plasmopara halstedii]
MIPRATRHQMIPRATRHQMIPRATRHQMIPRATHHQMIPRATRRRLISQATRRQLILQATRHHRSSDAKGTSSAVFVTIGVLAACIFVGALLFAMYSRKKRRDGAQADGFGGAAAFVAPAASIASDLEGSSSNDTPKSDIVTM